MLFPTLDYLVFLPLCVILYWVTPRRTRLGVMLAASVLFYASWRLEYLAILAAVVGPTWGGSVWVEDRPQPGQSLQGPWVTLLPPTLRPLVVL